MKSTIYPCLTVCMLVLALGGCNGDGNPVAQSTAHASATATAKVMQASAGSPFGGTPWPVPGQVQVENFDSGGLSTGYYTADNTNHGGQYRTSEGVSIEATTDTGGGYDVGWAAAGEWLNYTVNVTSPGTYALQVRVANSGPGGTFHFNVDGVSATGEYAVPDTGGWQNWQTLSSNITLTAGVHTIQLQMDSVGSAGTVGNFNWFSVINASNSTVPDFGPNVLIFDPTMSASSIQSQLDNVFSQQETNQFGTNRYALLFKPGSYNVDVNVGFYTQVLGLGQSPDDVTINGAVHAEADWFQGNATQNFWRGAENMAVVPSGTGGTDRWAVSQASPWRRMHIKGNVVLDDNGGWSSGGFLADSVIDSQINSGSQQQWLSRNSQWGSWIGSNWNMVFVGVNNAPSGTWPNPPYVVVNQTPVSREKPFLTIDTAGHYNVFVPSVKSNSQGAGWVNAAEAGQLLPISQFYVAKQNVDTAATLNAALAQGLNLLFTPGVYHLNGNLHVTRANTVILGLGIATLEADNGVTAMSVDDADGVVIAGLLFDAGSVNSPVLLQVGPQGSSQNHAANPTSLHDLFFRVGGAAAGAATVSLQINSNNVIGDDFWLWRADHSNGVGWTVNPAANGLVVTGANATIYGLAVEHYEQYQTLWSGNGGRVYFYQSEAPYDVPNQASWMNGSENGYASYKVASSVTSHQAWGVGIYCYFSTNSSVKLANAIETPNGSGIAFKDMTTVSLGGVGEITHVINNTGGTANSSASVVRLGQYP
ncbi:carbohydrate-binding protein [Paraburkholderia acidicola]|uniref:Carbohydrate-binding protein n=1 Tax=Paraburkholderia acidicola TaxID=1912599 RepID=A0ABV1LW29_9BURK